MRSIDGLVDGETGRKRERERERERLLHMSRGSKYRILAVSCSKNRQKHAWFMER